MEGDLEESEPSNGPEKSLISNGPAVEDIPEIEVAPEEPMICQSE